MRSAVKNKLHSRRGASLLIALLFFLTAMTVGAVVLTAAATNAGRIARSRQDQQNYLAVSSAAELIEEDLEGSKFKAEYTKTVKKITAVTVPSDPEAPPPDPQIETSYADTCGLSEGGSKLLGSAPQADLINIYKDVLADTAPESGLGQKLINTSDFKHPLKFAVAEGELPEGVELPEVSGTMTVSTGYGLTGPKLAKYAIAVELHTTGEEGGVSPNNTMTMLFEPVVQRQERTEVKEEDTVVTQSTDAAGNVISTTTTTTVTTVTTYTTTIAWDAPKIVKGAVK